MSQLCVLVTDESNSNNGISSSTKTVSQSSSSTTRSRQRKEPSQILTPAQASAKRIIAEQCGKTWSFVCPCGQKSNSFSHQEALQQHSNSSNSGCRTPTKTTSSTTSASHDTVDKKDDTTIDVQEGAVEVEDSDGGVQFECSTCGVSLSY
jgi:hypothetical protein